MNTVRSEICQEITAFSRNSRDTGSNWHAARVHAASDYAGHGGTLEGRFTICGVLNERCA
jgi:hypothetical protein